MSTLIAAFSGVIAFADVRRPADSAGGVLPAACDRGRPWGDSDVLQ